MDGVATISGSPGPPLWFTLLPILAVLVLVVPLVLGALYVLKGDAVHMPNRAAQLYGYTVCLITLIISLISTSSILNAAFERAHPLQSEFDFGVTLSSFEAYKATYRRGQAFDRGTSQPDTASDATLRQRYDALVADRVAATRYKTAKTLTTSTIMLLLSLVLFVLHWRWVRRLNGAAHA